MDDAMMTWDEIETAQARRREVRLTLADLYKCGNCGGTGHIAQFSHVSGGSCFKCSGSGRTQPRAKRDLAVFRALETELFDLEASLGAHNAAVDALNAPLPDLDTLDLSALLTPVSD